MLGNPSIEQIEGLTRTAADQGFSSFWIAQATTVDALTLTAATSGIPEIEFATALVPTSLRHPSMLAAQDDRAGSSGND